MALLKALFLDIATIILSVIVGGRPYSSSIVNELQESEESRGDAWFIITVLAAFGAFIYALNMLFG